MGIEEQQNQKDYRKFIEIIGNKNFIDKYKKSKALTKDILKEVFSFNYNDYNEYNELNDIQKEINENNELVVDKSLLECFDEIIK